MGILLIERRPKPLLVCTSVVELTDCAEPTGVFGWVILPKLGVLGLTRLGVLALGIPLPLLCKGVPDIDLEGDCSFSDDAVLTIEFAL